MIVSICGKPGSGKSSVAKAIAKEFNLKRYYMGRLRREMARDRGMTLAELNKLGEQEEFTDKEVDDYQKKLGQTEDNFVIEGRTSFFLIPQSYKIFLDVSTEEGAKRIWGDLQTNREKRNEANGLNGLEDVKKSINDRMTSDTIRYRKYYDVDVFEKKHYDLYLDTTNIDKEGVIKKVIESIKEYVDRTAKKSS